MRRKHEDGEKDEELFMTFHGEKGWERLSLSFRASMSL
jgi:hypothetical protein